MGDGLRRSYRVGFELVLERVREALGEFGFGVLTEIDVQGTLREKLGVSMERYVILGACNPPLAHRALAATRAIGLLLPCNVVVRQDEEDAALTVVEAVDPTLMSDVTGEQGVADVAVEARQRLEAAFGALDRVMA